MTREHVFLRLLEEALADERDGADAWVEWVAGRVDGSAVVVLYQWVEHRYGRFTAHPVDGRRFVLDEYAQAIYGRPDQPLNDLFGDAILEIREPEGRGRHLEVDWADGLVADPRAVEWHGQALEGR